jgi:hypothetical protein
MMRRSSWLLSRRMPLRPPDPPFMGFSLTTTTLVAAREPGDRSRVCAVQRSKRAEPLTGSARAVPSVRWWSKNNWSINSSHPLAHRRSFLFNFHRQRCHVSPMRCQQMSSFSLISFITSSRRFAISSAVSASRFRRSSGSVFDGRTLNHHVGNEIVMPSRKSTCAPSAA